VDSEELSEPRLTAVNSRKTNSTTPSLSAIRLRSRLIQASYGAMARRR
jgi:hypothetical protein